MKDTGIKEKFILLRAEGLSFDKISKKINVSKPTLIEWQKDFRHEIKEAQEIRFTQILEKYSMIKEKRIERISKELEQLWKAYEKIDYKDMNKRELFMMITRLDKVLKEEIEPFENVQMKEDKEENDYKIIVQRQIIGEGGKIISESEPGEPGAKKF